MPADDVKLILRCEQLDTSALHVHRLRARERMNQTYRVEVDVVCLEGDPPSMDDLAGCFVTVDLVRGASQRSFRGHVVEVRERRGQGMGSGSAAKGQLGFKLVLAPHMWLMTLVETLDIHLHESIPAIIEKKLALIDLSVGQDYAMRLVGDYASREMVVQYQETDHAFVSRWCEHYGIFYYIVHGPKNDRVVFGDHTGAYTQIDGPVAFVATGERTGIFALEGRQRLVPRTFVCRDYNDQTPTIDLQAEHKLDEGFGGGVIGFGGDFDTIEQGQRLAEIRAGERLAEHRTFEGQSDELRFAPGHAFELAGHPQHGGQMLLLEVEHTAAQEVGGWGRGDETPYANRFVAIDASLCFRPPRNTRKPRIHGIVSGIVETQQGEVHRDAKIDHQGRYTVRFLFDTSAPGEAKASCPVRMMQPSAGPGYGIHFPLKPGIEVAIAFLNGNPDRPVIVGAVPNPITQTPVAAAGSTLNRIMSRSGILLEFDDATRGQ